MEGLETEYMVFNKKVGSVLIGSLTVLGLSSCSTVDSLLEADRIDYKSETSSQAQGRRLEIPPDLTQLQRDNRYTIPESGTVTASVYNQQQQEARPNMAVGSSGVVAPNEATDIRIERDGSQRWLVVNRSPEVLWPQIRDFWQDNGFLINIDSPDTGIMETDWAENRAKLPQDFIRKTLGKVFDALYSTGERDKFRTRLERNADGTTDIFISHRGAQEEIVGVNKDTTMWTARPSDPELEAEFLSRLMVQLSDMNQKEKARAKALAEQKTVVLPSRATLVKGEGSSKVVVDETFDRTWRRVGLALDRVGFTVEDRDRSKGLYFVRYVDQDSDAKNTPEKEKGFFSNLFTFSNKEKHAQRYQISVQETSDKSEIVVLDDKGQPEKTSTGRKIMDLLYEQLR